MIAVIDYRAGNLTSVMKALNALGATAQITEDPAVVRAADNAMYIAKASGKNRICFSVPTARDARNFIPPINTRITAQPAF